MARKSIGQFIAALRKANGMTQKQLAERLNVSDKAVSRWERDESAPDLSLIPVIAEIFGVTSDEILRGERKNQDNDELPFQSNTKVEKQIEHLINDSRTKFTIRSIIAAGIGFLGLLAAIICNFCFYRAGLGFLIGCLFYVVAAICEVSFFILAVNSIKTSGFDGESVNKCKKELFRSAVFVFSIILFLLFISIPFIEQGSDYFGIAVEEWLIRGAIYVLIYTFTCSISITVANRIAVKKGFFTLSEKEQENSNKILTLKIDSAIILAIMLVVTLICHYIYDATSVYDYIRDAVKGGREYTDLAEFKEYIETDEPLEYTEFHFGYSVHHNESVEESATQTLDDEYIYDRIDGEEIDDEITYDDYETFTIDAPDGTVLCEYKHINTNVVEVEVEYWGDKVTVHTYTMADTYRANHVTKVIRSCIVSAYFIEALGVIIGYNVKKRRIVK